MDFVPQSVYRHRSRGWLYIPIQPFADEPEELARLALTPEDCTVADVWWAIEEDAALVQSCIARLASRPPGLYARRTEHEEGWVYLLAVLDAHAVTRASFESVLSQFAALGFPADASFRLPQHGGPVRLAGGAA